MARVDKFRLFLLFLLVCAFSKPVYGQGPGGYNTNLQLWLMGNAGVTGSPVQTWTDQSVNAYSFTQATVASRPAINLTRLNFNPSLIFDGTSQQLINATGIMGTAVISDVNVIAVLRTNVVTASSVFYEPQSSGGRFNAHVPWSNNVLYWDAGTAGTPQRIQTPWTGTAGNSYMWTMTASTTSIPSTGAAGQEIYKNGLMLASDADMASFTGNNSAMSVGNGFGFYNGEISEFIVYNGVMPAAQLQQIHSYLAIKYGLTLDQTSPQDYVASDGTITWNGTSYGGYKFDIAGIGRDDISLLSQLKSTSSNTPADIITIANTNFAAPAAFGTDIQFLIWGNNGFSTSANITAPAIVHNGTTIQAKSQRNWSTAVTAAPAGNAIVEVNMALVGGPTGVGTNANTDLRLLIDNDATFGNASVGELVISPTAGFPATGGKVYFTLPYANIPAGQGFFSIGSVNKSTCPLAAPSPGGVSVLTKLWLKADADVTGSPVSAWADQSGNGFTISQGTVASRPAFMPGRVNFNPSVQFNGTNSQLTLASGIMGTTIYTDFNAFLVARTNVVSSSSVFFESQSAGGRINAHIPWSDTFLYWDAGNSGSPQRLATAWTGIVNTSYVWGLTASTTSIPTTSAVGQEVYKNGALIASDADMASFTGNNSTFYLGSLAGSNFYNGEVSELVLYTAPFSTSQVQNVTSYLAAKYGITIDQTIARNYTASDWNGVTGTISWSAATGGVYKNDIAMIARDDASSLNQKQSGSSNSGNVLFIANTGFAVDNPTNTNTLGADKSFLSWAHNGAALASKGVADFAGPTIKARIARVWKAQETGTVGTVRVRFDLSTVPGVGNAAGANDLNNVRLLVDADGVFNAGATIVAPASVNNATDIVEFNHDFVAGTGFFFTIGSTDLATAPLPVELLSFDAKANDKNVEVTWVTESEVNSDYFQVEASQDGESWNSVHQTKGKGTTTSRSKYSAVDNTPFGGLSYYRLRQVDFNGASQVSKVVAVKFESNSILMYPNPVEGEEVTFELSGKSIATGIQIVNMSGVEMLRTPLEDTKGQKQKFSVSVQGFAPGMYIVTLFTKETLQHTKLIVR